MAKGDYSVGTPGSRIAVVTLASSLEQDNEAAMWGTCKTENLGAEKIVVNTISNSNIRFILLCGGESRGHLAGKTLLALHSNGIDENGRIIGSDGAIPFIENIPKSAIERFQRQVTIIDHIGLTDPGKIKQIVDEYKNMGSVFDEEPMIFLAAKKKRRISDMEISGDIMISDDFMIDSASGIVCSIEGK